MTRNNCDARCEGYVPAGATACADTTTLTESKALFFDAARSSCGPPEDDSDDCAMYCSEPNYELGYDSTGKLTCIKRDPACDPNNRYSCYNGAVVNGWKDDNYHYWQCQGANNGTVQDCYTPRNRVRCYISDSFCVVHGDGDLTYYTNYMLFYPPIKVTCRNGYMEGICQGNGARVHAMPNDASCYDQDPDDDVPYCEFNGWQQFLSGDGGNHWIYCAGGKLLSISATGPIAIDPSYNSVTCDLQGTLWTSPDEGRGNDFSWVCSNSWRVTTGLYGENEC
jgi:hypothetical protein